MNMNPEHSEAPRSDNATRRSSAAPPRAHAFDRVARGASQRSRTDVSTIEEPDGWWARYGNVSATLYWGIHASCLLAFWVGVNATDLALFLTLFWLRLFGITGGFHRYFAHRSYKTSRPMQFALAFLGTSAVQKGPLWWCGNHRVHHRYSDQEQDPHSPRRGFWHAHQGWIFEPQWQETRLDEIRDFARFPELVWLNQWHIVPPILLAFACYGIGGFSGLLWGMGISTVACWHATYTINSLSHRWGRARFETGDDSKNNWVLALLTLGEGWHNNHHRFMNSTRQGFYWWEIDITWLVLRAMQAVGLVWDMKHPPASVYAEARANTLARNTGVAAAAIEQPSAPSSAAALARERATSG